MCFFNLVWLIVGTVWILPIYNAVIESSIGEDVSKALSTVSEQLGETGLAGSTTAAPAVSETITKSNQINSHNIIKVDPQDGCDQVLFHFTAGILAVGWIILAVAAIFIV